MKSKRIRGNELPWLDGEIIQLMRQRDRAHKIAKRSGSQNDWEVYQKNCEILLQNKFEVRKVNTLHQPSKKIKAIRLLCGKKPLRRFSLANRK